MKSKTTAQMTLIQKKVGKRICTLRRARGWSQPRMAPLVGIHVSHLSQLERGVANPTLSTLVALATALQVDVCDLLQDISSLRLAEDSQPAMPKSKEC